jgi:hypothetical protein
LSKPFKLIEFVAFSLYTFAELVVGSPPKFNKFNSVTLNMTESELISVNSHYSNLYGSGYRVFNISILVRMGIYFSSFIVPIILILSLLLSLRIDLKIFSSNFFAIPTLLIGILTMLVLFKIYYRIIEKICAESICVREILYILFELDREDSLTQPINKAVLLYRMEYLSKINLILETRINSRKVEWLENHFKNIYEYIQERRRWVVSPTRNTLNDLRRDFIFLANIYVSGQYGEFKWEEPFTETKKTQKTDKLSILKLFVKFLGITFPLLIMGLYLYDPNKFFLKAMDVEYKDPVTYIFLAWLLISVDITLKLGIVESLVKLAQGLRDLGK